MTTWDIGDAVTLGADFKDKDGQATNPTTTVCTVKKPDGTTITPAVVPGATGHFEAEVTADQPGIWTVRWTGTGALVAAEERRFQVRRSAVI